MNIILGILLTVIVVALGYAVLRALRKKKSASASDIHYGFRPRVGFSRLDGMESLSLLLENGFHKYIWAEEIRTSLADLVADKQTAEPTLHETKKILQMIAPGDTLPISLAETIYKAAGEPQRKHSSLLTSVLRYRVGEEWFEKQLDTYKIEMMGLTASDARRVHKSENKIQRIENPKEVAVAASNSK